MSYRNFLDPEKRPWGVWLVLPTAVERRRGERRVAKGSTAAAYKGIERRTNPSRRRSSFPLGPGVDPGYEKGWLCFENEEREKRRLVPIPEDWERASDEQLWLWCRRAIPVMKSVP
jgi:hypothetical protein